MSLFHFGSTAEHGHDHGTAVEQLDPRVKLLCGLGLALWVGLVPPASVGLLGFVGVGLIVLGGLAQIAPATLIIRSSAALPFVVVPALLRLFSDTPLHEVGVMAARGYVAAMVATLLVSITPFPDLLAAAARLGVPDLLVQTTALIYRYLVVLRERAAAMTASAAARGYGLSTPGRFAVAGDMLGSLLLRSLDRSDRVYAAMLARGYSGRFPQLRPMKMRAVDWAVGLGVWGMLGGSLPWLR